MGLFILNNEMKKDTNKLDLILQNNSDKRVWIFSGLTDVSTSNQYVQFDNFEMPEDAPDGEYTYLLLQNYYSGSVEYKTAANIYDTIVVADGKEIEIKMLRPVGGLLRVGAEKQANIYQEKEKNKTFYYKK